jgi:hypothetical protein
MAVICNECGKPYDVDPEMIERLKGTSFKIRCDECGSICLLSQMLKKDDEPSAIDSDASDMLINKKSDIPMKVKKLHHGDHSAIDSDASDMLINKKSDIPMKVKKLHHGDHFVVTLIGIPAIIFLIALIVLSLMLMNALEPDDAEHRVRMILMREISQHHMEELKSSGMKIPDEQMANRWLKEINQTKSLEFLSLSLKNPILDIFTPDAHSFVAQVVIRDEKQQERTRYFWLSWAGIDREISKTAWFFSI